LLDDADAQVLYLHLQTDAAPGEESRDAFVRGARAMFASLCAGSSNRFALVLWSACKCSLWRPFPTGALDPPIASHWSPSVPSHGTSPRARRARRARRATRHTERESSA
jgi:hypothetical protein